MRPLVAALLFAAALLPVHAQGPAGAPAAGDPWEDVRGLMAPERPARRAALERLVARGDRSLVPGIVDALFFIPRPARAEALAALERLAGERAGDSYWDWVELVGRRQDLVPAAGYAEWKTSLLARIDPTYRTILYPGAPARIRLEEIVTGGVKVDGIPALERPPHLPAAEARYLDDRERVFGVDLGGEQRAYPLRILDWHEMANDVVGGLPVTISYCTLCGAAVLYSARAPNGDAYTFGTSGLLYRSNKLMYDRQTRSLWSNLTGEPVVGRLARSPARLEPLPITLTTWGEWRRRHPRTTALALDTGQRAPGYDYRPGAADRARRGVSFPVWLKSSALPAEAEVYALRLGERAKAYPVEKLLAAGVVNDRLGDEPVVLVADRESGAIRAYRRGERTFRRGDGPDALLDEAGRPWRVEEGRLAGPEEAEGTEPLPRLPGHHSFWFGWYAFFPGTEVWGAAPPG